MSKVRVVIGAATLTDVQVQYCLDMFASMKKETMDKRKTTKEPKPLPVLMLERFIDLFQDPVIYHPGWWPMEQHEEGSAEAIRMDYLLRNGRWQYVPITAGTVTLTPFYTITFMHFIITKVTLATVAGNGDPVAQSIQEIIDNCILNY